MKEEYKSQSSEIEPRAVMINVLKGGLGKSTIAKNTARSLANRGRVLVVDTDDNGHLTKHLGFTDKFKGGNKLYEYLDEDSDVKLNDLIYETDFGFDLLHSTKKMEHVEMAFEEEINPNTVLREHITDRLLGETYDYILFDTPANRSLMTRNAALAAGNMIIPLAPGEQGKDGLNATIDRIYNQINTRTDNGMKLLAIVPNKIQRQIDHNNSHRRLIEYLSTSERTQNKVPNFAYIPEAIWNEIDQNEFNSNPKPGIRTDSELNNPEPIHDVNPESDTIKYFKELADIVQTGEVKRDEKRVDEIRRKYQ